MSVKRLIQNTLKSKKNASIVIITHKSKNSNLVKSIKELSNKKFIINKPKFFRLKIFEKYKQLFSKRFLKACERAAYGASKYRGLNDKIAADQAAVDEMQSQLNKMEIKGRIVIGEGEMDEAPMLYIGEEVGKGKGDRFDIAVDPLEGTNFTAKNLPNAISVMCVTQKNGLLSAPDTYMEKIAIGSGLPKNIVDLDNSVEKNIQLLCSAKKSVPKEITACVLKRPRHDKLINSLNNMNVKIKFIRWRRYWCDVCSRSRVRGRYLSWYWRWSRRRPCCCST